MTFNTFYFARKYTSVNVVGVSRHPTELTNGTLNVHSQSYVGNLRLRQSEFQVQFEPQVQPSSTVRSRSLHCTHNRPTVTPKFQIRTCTFPFKIKFHPGVQTGSELLR